jgi:hypothetical protein
MFRLIRIELIILEVIFSLQNSELIRRHIAEQAAFLCTNRTSAACELLQIRIDLELDRAAVAPPMVGLHRFLSLFFLYEIGWPPVRYHTLRQPSKWECPLGGGKQTHF